MYFKYEIKVQELAISYAEGEGLYVFGQTNLLCPDRASDPALKSPLMNLPIEVTVLNMSDLQREGRSFAQVTSDEPLNTVVWYLPTPL